MEKGTLPRFHSPDLQLTRSMCSAAWIVFFAVASCMPVLAQSGALDKVMASIERELEPSLGPVRLHRVEKLEDEVFVPSGRDTDADSHLLIFQIEQKQFFFKNNEILQIASPGVFSQYIGISRDGQHIYRLAGASDSEDNFRNLVRDFKFRAPRNISDAQSRALYCSQVVYGIDPTLWVLDERGVLVQYAIALSSRGSGDPLKEAKRWLRHVRRTTPSLMLNLTTTTMNDGTFVTVLPFLWAPVETASEPKIRTMSIRVDSDGSCWATHP